jgi:hypothetical protein
MVPALAVRYVGMHAAAIERCLFIFLEDPDNPERLCSAVRVLRLSISISFEARTPLKQTHLHTSTTVNLSSAILAIWRTVSLPPAYL